jgi:3-oxoacyl-(acyl-carrier-protein) synthase
MVECLHQYGLDFARVVAVRDAALSDSDLHSSKTACIVGTGIGSVESIYAGAHHVYSGEIGRMSPFTVLKGMASSSSAAVANLLKMHGRSYAGRYTCCAGTTAEMLDCSSACDQA